MRRINDLKNNQGFTLIETSILVIIVGILAAIATPSFFSWLNNKKVDNALASIEGALREAQAEAGRKSKPCTFSIDPVTAEVTAFVVRPDPLPAGYVDESCLPTGSRDLTKLGISVLDNNDSGISVALATADNEITFTPKGTTTDSNVFVIFRTDNSRNRCLAVSSGIGIMRTGTYTGQNPAETSPVGQVDETACDTD